MKAAVFTYMLLMFTLVKAAVPDQAPSATQSVAGQANPVELRSNPGVKFTKNRKGDGPKDPYKKLESRTHSDARHSALPKTNVKTAERVET